MATSISFKNRRRILKQYEVENQNPIADAAFAVLALSGVGSAAPLTVALTESIPTFNANYLMTLQGQKLLNEYSVPKSEGFINRMLDPAKFRVARNPDGSFTGTIYRGTDWNDTALLGGMRTMAKLRRRQAQGAAAYSTGMAQVEYKAAGGYPANGSAYFVAAVEDVVRVSDMIYRAMGLDLDGWEPVIGTNDVTYSGGANSFWGSSAATQPTKMHDKGVWWQLFGDAVWNAGPGAATDCLWSLTEFANANAGAAAPAVQSLFPTNPSSGDQYVYLSIECYGNYFVGAATVMAGIRVYRKKREPCDLGANAYALRYRMTKEDLLTVTTEGAAVAVSTLAVFGSASLSTAAAANNAVLASTNMGSRAATITSGPAWPASMTRFDTGLVTETPHRASKVFYVWGWMGDPMETSFSFEAADVVWNNATDAAEVSVLNVKETARSVRMLKADMSAFLRLRAGTLPGADKASALTNCDLFDASAVVDVRCVTGPTPLAASLNVVTSSAPLAEITTDLSVWADVDFESPTGPKKYNALLGTKTAHPLFVSINEALSQLVYTVTAEAINVIGPAASKVFTYDGAAIPQSTAINLIAAGASYTLSGITFIEAFGYLNRSALRTALGYEPTSTLKVAQPGFVEDALSRWSESNFEIRKRQAFLMTIGAREPLGRLALASDYFSLRNYVKYTPA